MCLTQRQEQNVFGQNLNDSNISEDVTKTQTKWNQV